MPYAACTLNSPLILSKMIMDGSFTGMRMIHQECRVVWKAAQQLKLKLTAVCVLFAALPDLVTLRSIGETNLDQSLPACKADVKLRARDNGALHFCSTLLAEVQLDTAGQPGQADLVDQLSTCFACCRDPSRHKLYMRWSHHDQVSSETAYARAYAHMIIVLIALPKAMMVSSCTKLDVSIKALLIWHTSIQSCGKSGSTYSLEKPRYLNMLSQSHLTWLVPRK